MLCLVFVVSAPPGCGFAGVLKFRSVWCSVLSLASGVALTVLLSGRYVPLDGGPVSSGARVSGSLDWAFLWVKTSRVFLARAQ